jgi:hypothetical protein
MWLLLAVGLRGYRPRCTWQRQVNQLLCLRHVTLVGGLQAETAVRLPGFQIPPSEVVERYGPELGQRLVDLSGAACDLVFNLIDRFDINCEARRPGYVQAAVGKRGLQIRDRLVRACQG